MRKPITTFILVALLAAPAIARGHRASGASRRSPSVRCSTCARDRRGNIKRSKAAVDAFRKAHPCPSTGRTSGSCPGYVIDHVQALEHGGADSPLNMQWQTKAEAKAKDKIE